MHERKAAMSDAADAFIMLPGGYGTFDEFFEAVSWTQLGVHNKPCGVLDVAGYFAPLAKLQLRPETELYLGLIHHDDAAGDAARLACARRHVRVDGIATECGMARGDPKRR